MSGKLAVLPIDARPVTRDLPQQLAKMAGWQVILPDRDQLGFLKQPADRKTIANWLRKHAPDVDGFILSADMLGYGGLVPSRINTESVAAIQEQLNIIKDIRNQYPHKKLMLFSATMRISNNYINEEEKEYWKDYGEELWAYSYHSHRYEKTNDTESLTYIKKLENKIPSPIQEDYIKTRQRNFEVNQYLMQMVEENFIDLLVYPQDDTSEYGMNIREQEYLQTEMTKRGLFDQVLIYPGADEVASTLTARMIYTLEGVTAPGFFPMYSGERGSLTPAMYEDRPICESVKGQIYAFGSHSVDQLSDADIILAVNVPGKRQGDLALHLHTSEVDTNDRNLGEWLKRIQFHQSKERPVAIADVAYANGADPALVPQLLHRCSFLSLYGFAGWNTAGNTLGTVVAQAALKLLAEKKGLSNQVEIEWNQSLLLRLLDDYLYQSVVRDHIRAQIDETTSSPQQLRQLADQIFRKYADDFLSLYQLNASISKLYMPWDRTFEIGIELSNRGDQE